MTLYSAIQQRHRGLRLTLIVLLAVLLAAGAYVIWPARTGNKIVGYFTSAVGLYPGDQIRIVGVPVGKIESIEPRAEDVKITMSVDRDVKVPQDARAIIMAPNLVAARFIQIAPAYTSGPVMSDGASIALAHTAVPVEWDEVKQSLTDLAKQLSPAAGQMQGPLGKNYQSGGGYVQRQRRLIPFRASRAFASHWPAWGFAHGCLRHREKPRGYWSTRCRRATNRSSRSLGMWHRCRRCSPRAQPISIRLSER